MRTWQNTENVLIVHTECEILLKDKSRVLTNWVSNELVSEICIFKLC